MHARLLAIAALALACGCSSSSSPSTPPTDAGSDAPPATCFTNPHTYLEIINACTDAQAIDKTDDLSPMNLPDGGLTPLP